MKYDPKVIAEWFIHRASAEGDPVTQMKLQKLVYMAHGWNLGLFDSPLIDDVVEAWKWGPVIRSLYGDYVRFGASAIDAEPDLDYPKVGTRTKKLLKKIWGTYGQYTAAQLSDLTHRKGTPWSQVYDPNRKKVIPNRIIQAHYKELARD